MSKVLTVLLVILLSAIFLVSVALIVMAFLPEPSYFKPQVVFSLL